MGICVVRLTTKIKIKYDTSLAYNIYTVLCAVNLNKMTKEKPRQIEVGEWLYKGCFIQESIHPKLIGKYEVFKNDEPQTHVGRCYTFNEAKKLCEENECFENVLSF